MYFNLDVAKLQKDYSCNIVKLLLSPYWNLNVNCEFENVIDSEYKSAQCLGDISTDSTSQACTTKMVGDGLTYIEVGDY